MPAMTEDTVRRRYSDDERIALLRFLRLSDPKRFQLAAVEVWTPLERDALIAWLRQQFPTRLFCEVSLRELPGASLIDELAPVVAELHEQSDAPVLVLSDLEELQSSPGEQPSRTFAQLNVQRDLLVQAWSMPVLLCAHPAALLRLAVEAPDFYDYLSTKIQALREPEARRGAPFERDPCPDYGVTLVALGPEETIERLRKRVTERSAAYLPDLARSLRGLAASHHRGGRHEAPESAEEAVTIFRELVRREGDAFLPDLALSLRVLGVTRSAHEPIREAAQIYRALASQRPETYHPRLADSLDDLGAILHQLGDAEAALKAATEAVQLHRTLAARDPAVFAPKVAASLCNLGSVRASLGLHEGAIEAVEEAVQLHGELAARDPETFRPRLEALKATLGAANAPRRPSRPR